MILVLDFAAAAGVDKACAILTLQELLREFVTDPETGDNRYITQSVFFNRNITCNVIGKKRKFLNPIMYGSVHKRPAESEDQICSGPVAVSSVPSNRLL